MDIFEFLQKEHELVTNAPRIYGDVFESTNNILIYFEQCFSPADKKAHISTLFLLQTQKSLCLSTVSALRHHRVQMFHMLRDALESVVRACCALHFPDQNEFDKLENGMLVPKKKLSKKLYEWFEENYMEYSEKIKEFKEVINTNFAHPTLVGTSQNLTVDGTEQRVGPVFFDPMDKKEIERCLWMIGDVAIGFMKIYATVLQSHPLVGADPLFSEKISALSLESERIKVRLEKKFDPEILKMSKERT